MTLTKIVKATPNHTGRLIHIGDPFTNVLGESDESKDVRLTMDSSKPNTIIVEFLNDNNEWGDNGASKLLEGE